MKRCPQCNRLEPDDTLGYCRADGTALISDSGPVSAALIRATFARDGWPGFLRLVTAESSPLNDSNNNWVVAKAYLDLGQKDKAFAELNKAYENRLSSLCWLKVEPQLDSLRSDPRYQQLLQKMGFSQ